MILLTVILDSHSKEVQMVWGCKIIYMYVYIYVYGICVHIDMYMYGIYDIYGLFHPKILKVKG